ncbi:bifunctional rhamnulose-1-phosphate aldolase/short-chain dehydrogenase [Limnoglobus roseus]|uniref:3-oxoacyl-ACP reductase n=1 Tax=Limnoglobus roseus TaxID=2598579 RepID=A0A5C1A6U8_9BACT|nr:bifunctional rhamnulose-1-phosphate aldolase/short-chain dehydrogenase [Limnoglobus roseus]QEL14979.1 3-oxoacyl-ACP reductase [Limnoglobus roseus]
MNQPDPFRHVHDLWNDSAAARLDAVGRLVYRSNLLGSDPRVTNTGGGNTSSKVAETDPLTGEPIDVLWVKGSGGDLRTATRGNFASLEQTKLLGLRKTYAARPDRGPKSVAEDDMVGLFAHCAFNLNPRAASIDTPLHGFIPRRCVDHTHPNAVIALAASADAERLTREVYGDEVIYTPWLRPGFELGLRMQQLVVDHPHAKGILMGQHGLINWADDDRTCYSTTLGLIERAARFIEAKYAANGGDATAFGGPLHRTLPEVARCAVFAKLLPWLRGQVSRRRRQVATIQHAAAILRFVNATDAARLADLGTSCPDHFLRTKIKPLYVPLDPGELAGDPESLVRVLKAKLATGLEQYRADYAAYYAACQRADSPPVRDANPTVILIPGVGMIAWGKDKSESRVTAEFYNCAVEVMRGADAVSRYVALPRQEAFDIEYWQLEEAKLRRMPPEKELAGRVAVVIGAGSGIGREVAHRLAKDGAHVACADVTAAAAQATADEITTAHGAGIGVAGTGISGGGPAVGLACDVTSRASIRAMLDQVALAYGGFDAVVVTAGVFVPSDATGHIPDDKWAVTFAVNVAGGYLVADEAATTFREQCLTGSVVLTTSANAVVPKKGSVAYDCSKAAANHLVRELAVELAPLVRVNGVAPATVVAGSAMFPRDRVIGSLAKYGIAYRDDEPTDALVARLAAFYADRTLTKTPITPADQAEAVFLLVGDRLSKTTGQIIAVDGGLHEAFLR